MHGCATENTSSNGAWQIEHLIEPQPPLESSHLIVKRHGDDRDTTRLQHSAMFPKGSGRTFSPMFDEAQRQQGVKTGRGEGSACGVAAEEMEIGPSSVDRGHRLVQHLDSKGPVAMVREVADKTPESAATFEHHALGRKVLVNQGRDLVPVAGGEKCLNVARTPSEYGAHESSGPAERST